MAFKSEITGFHQMTSTEYFTSLYTYIGIFNVLLIGILTKTSVFTMNFSTFFYLFIYSGKGAIQFVYNHY